jgi:hypothetical protein
MPSGYAYEVQVGKNVASLKAYHNPKKPRLHLEHLEKGELLSRTTATSIEVPLAIVSAGLALGVLSHLSFKWTDMSIYVTMSLGFLFCIAAAVVVIYGIGIISARCGFRYKDQQGEYLRRFFWITRRQEVGRADYVYCTGTLDLETPSCYVLDVCLHYDAPIGPIAVTQLRGYARIPFDKGAQYTPFENALFQIHEKAQDVAKKLELPFKPNFSGGPVPDQFAAFFQDAEADEKKGAGVARASEEDDKAED